MELSYKNEQGINIIIPISDDLTLTEVFARFVEFTRMVGYQSGSWTNIIQDLAADIDEYNIFDWASEVIYR